MLMFYGLQEEMKLRENAMSKEQKKQRALNDALVRENPIKTKIVRFSYTQYTKLNNDFYRLK